MGIPDGIETEHILAALAELDAEAAHPFGEPTKYELVHGDKRYPPKAVIGIAARHATGKQLGPQDFGGGEGSGQANHALRSLGFEIVAKASTEDSANSRTDSPSTYLFTWNPRNWPWDSLERDMREVKAHGSVRSTWTTGKTKRIAQGDRFFLLRQGAPPRGILASGRVVGDVYEEPHWDEDQRKAGKQVTRVDVEFDCILPPNLVLPVGELKEGALGDVHWTTQKSGIRVPDEATNELEDRWTSHRRRLEEGGGLPPLDPARIERVRNIVKQQFPDFSTFAEPGHRFREQEDDYKREAVGQARKILGPYVQGDELMEDDQEALDVASQILDLTNFLNWRDKDYIKRKLLAEPGRWQRFMNGIVACLKVSHAKDWAAEFDRLMSWLAEIGCNANISKILPTYFLFLWDPEHHISIKPAIFDHFLERIGVEPLGHGTRLTRSEYQRALATMTSLRAALADWEPRDLVDLQSLYWVVERQTDEDVEGPTDSLPPAEDDPVYTIDEAMKGLFMPRESFEEILQLLRWKKNVILQGPPGTGKTFVARRLANALMGVSAPDRVSFVQFHQSYAYEDFIQGHRPAEDGRFRLKNGLFYEFCQRARKDLRRRYVFIIDEINRGNLSKIFGELMMLIEADKRGSKWAIPLTYSRDPSETFYVSENCYILGMMNTADRSLAMVDYALRRRFAFYDLVPAFDSARFSQHLVERGAAPELVETIRGRMESLNNAIAEDTTNLGPGFRIGHSFFCPQDGDFEFDTEWYRRIIKTEIAPILREYWFDNPRLSESKIDDLLVGV